MAGKLVLVAVLLTVFATPSLALEPKRVLIVHSFGTVAPPFTTGSTAFQTELVRLMGNRVDLDEVALDMARHAQPEMQQAVADYLEKRGAKWKPDLVVPVGGPAGTFVAKFRQRLFPKVPILYDGLDRRLLGAADFDENTAFIGANYEVKGFVEDILQIAPETKNIAVVIGATPLERYWAEEFRKGFGPFADRVNFIWLNDLSLDQMLERVQTLPPHSFIFLILLLRDAAGVTHNADEALQSLHAVANAPINSVFTSQMGLGIVGGRLYPTTEDGKEAARMAVQILDGALPSSLPHNMMPPTGPQYDWRELLRWKIPDKNLPAESKILFRRSTVWERYRTWIISGIALFMGETLLIGALLANLVRRRRAERSLTESEARFRMAADAAPVLMWMSGPNKLCTFFNKAWLELTGRSMDQELGNGWTEGVHAEEFKKCVESYERAFDARQPFAMQYRLRRHDGEYRWITDNGMPRYDPQGKFLGYVGACVDVTDLLKQEKALHESEERVALAAEAAQLGAWELDPATNEVWVSDKIRSLFQLESDRVSYAAFLERVHPEDRATRDATIKNAIDTKGAYDVEFRVLLPDGTMRWIGGRARCLTGGDGKVTRLLGVSMDVTKRKQAEELFRIATEASPSGTVLVNDKGQIVLVNAHVEELFGYSRAELVGKAIEILVPEGLRVRHPAYRPHFMAASEHRAIGEGRELFARRKDGSDFPVEIGLNPVSTPEGFLVLASVVDVSARKSAEEEARRRREQIDLMSRLSLLGEMTASIAHELNQPLAAIVSNASAGQRFIDRGNVDIQTLHEILVDVAADGRRAHEVLQNIRNTIKKGAAVREQIDLNDVVANVTHLIQPTAVVSSCEVQTCLTHNLPTIEGDPIQIQQVLINLVSNAFDAMREMPAPRRKVEITTHWNGDGIVSVAVRDHGPGISDEARQRLFEQFFTTKPEGLGMGLAIVRSVVEAHGGHIAVENMEAGGARFSCTLPVQHETVT